MVTVDRRYLELCVLSCAMVELKSGDLCIAGSEHFSDYRDQLVSWEDYAQQVETYCQQVGIAADPAQFVQDLQTQLTETIRTTDAAFPTNTALTIDDGEPVLRRLKKQPEPEGLALIDRLLSERMPECNIVDVLTDTEHWLHWTAAFGPLSGFEARLTSPAAALRDDDLLLRLLSGADANRPLAARSSIASRSPTSISAISPSRHSSMPMSA